MLVFTNQIPALAANAQGSITEYSKDAAVDTELTSSLEWRWWWRWRRWWCRRSPVAVLSGWLLMLVIAYEWPHLHSHHAIMSCGLGHASSWKSFSYQDRNVSLQILQKSFWTDLQRLFGSFSHEPLLSLKQHKTTWRSHSTSLACSFSQIACLMSRVWPERAAECSKSNFNIRLWPDSSKWVGSHAGFKPKHARGIKISKNSYSSFRFFILAVFFFFFPKKKLGFPSLHIWNIFLFQIYYINSHIYIYIQKVPDMHTHFKRQCIIIVM